MGKIRLQFLVSLILIMVVFIGVVLMESLLKDQIAALYNLEVRVNSVLLKWTRMVGQSSGLLASGDPIETASQNWKRDFDAYQNDWQNQVAALAVLANGDAELQDQVSWVSSTLGMGVGEMTYLDENLSKLVAQLRGENGEIIARISLAGLSDAFAESVVISPGVRASLFRVRDSARFFDQMIGALGSSQQRFEQQTTRRIQELKDTLIAFQLAFLLAGIVILLIFLSLILRLSTRLMDLVHLKTNDLVQALADLETTQATLTEAKRQAALSSMVVGISHEINTPLGVLMTANSRMVEKHREISGLVADESITRGNIADYLDLEGKLLGLGTKSIDRIRELITYFRSLSIKDEGFNYTRFKLADFLGSWLVQFSAEALRRGHSLRWECDPDLEISSCGQALFQVLSQLIANSFDFAFPDNTPGLIMIRIGRQDDRVRIAYTDDGIGITPRQAERIFDPFYTTGRNTKHIGLGLNIVHNLVAQYLGGNIFLEPQPKGSAFIIVLPLEYRPANPPVLIGKEEKNHGA